MKAPTKKIVSHLGGTLIALAMLSVGTAAMAKSSSPTLAPQSCYSNGQFCSVSADCCSGWCRPPDHDVTPICDSQDSTNKK